MKFEWLISHFSRPAGESSAEESGAEGGAAGAEAEAAAGAGGGAEQVDTSTQGEDSSSPKKKGRKRKVGYRSLESFATGNAQELSLLCAMFIAGVPFTVSK